MEGGPLLAPEAFDQTSAGRVYEELVGRLRAGQREVVLDMAPTREMSAFGAAAILEVHRAARSRGAEFRLLHLGEKHRQSLSFLRLDDVVAAGEGAQRREPLLERIGGWGIRLYRKAVQQGAMNLDALVYTFVDPVRHRVRSSRFGPFVHQLNLIGADSIGIVLLIDFLIGLIVALLSAYQLRQFGVTIYVADLVGVGMTRELGPLMTAIILAARSGSSIAAELGTMVVTEEVDALEVMAIEPKRFLISPRFGALLVSLPCLAILAEVAGIAGGMAIGVLGLDLGFTAYWNKTIGAIYMSDVLTGLVKSLVFANVIAIVSCHEGLSMKGGPEAVGKATTTAVVNSITLVILADFFFTTLFYFLR